MGFGGGLPSLPPPPSHRQGMEERKRVPREWAGFSEV